ncbi:MAG: hypothetical protein ACM3OB_06015 [Acidobacteriota bacterium]
MTTATPQPQPQPGKKKSWVKWVVLGCGVLLVLGAAFAALLFFVVKKATAGPEATVHQFLDAAGRGDYRAAYDDFSAPLKQAQSFAAFEASARQQSMMFQVKDTRFSTRSVDLSGAKLAGTLTLQAGTEVPAYFKLVKENGAWRLIAYRIGSGAEKEE